MTTRESKRVFNREYLDTLLTRDSATLLGSYDKLNSTIRIQFKCKCGKEYQKKFCDIAYYGGAFCKSCIIKNKTHKIKETCKQLYGVSNVSQVEKYQKKKEDTYIQNFGMHPKKTKEVQDKYKNTCIQRYGVENSAQTLETKQKIKEVFEEKYGGHPMFDERVKDKVKNTCIKKYGGSPAKNKDIKYKTEEYFLEKYGCHPSQTTEIQQKIQNNSKKYKKYTLPSGAVRLIQGYESFALEDLLKQNTEDEIVSERKYIPKFQYTINNKVKYYFPDIYLPNTKTIIEVKSSWTYEKDKDKLNCVKGVIENEGYTFMIWIYNKNGERENSSEP